VPLSDRAELPLIFVTVGTDHHPFDRLVRWIDRWLADGREDLVRCFVQSGTSTPPRLAEWRSYLRHEEVQAAMRSAIAVVTHGGPGSIMECRRKGFVPIVVPRLSKLGEHVDDHQVAFTQAMGMRGEVEVVFDEGRVRSLLDRALGEPEAFRRLAPPIDTMVAVRRFELLVDDLLGSA
jgi:UDP-N-acetylglucosamine transferase subunit ALG13